VALGAPHVHAPQPRVSLADEPTVCLVVYAPAAVHARSPAFATHARKVPDALGAHTPPPLHPIPKGALAGHHRPFEEELSTFVLAFAWHEPLVGGSFPVLTHARIV
jgi:hypothetical protein